MTKVDNNDIMKLDIKCGCGKLIARLKGEKLYLYCKQCRKEVEIKGFKIIKEEPWAEYFNVFGSFLICL